MNPVRKKILIACDSYKSLIDLRGRLIESLMHENHVYVFTPEVKNLEIKAKLQDMGVSLLENKLNSSNISLLADVKYIFKLYSTIRKIKPDVFFSYAFKPVIYGSFVARVCNVSNIVFMLTGLGYNFIDENEGKKTLKRVIKTLLKVSLNFKRANIIFHNKDDYNLLVRENIISSRQRAFVVNGSGIDLSHYVFSTPTRQQDITFLMIARLIKAKGVKEYYEAAKIVLEKNKNVRFILIGPYDDNIDRIEEEFFELIKNDGTLMYLGEVTDVRQYISDASVVVLPSYREGMPRCLLEAMAIGRPVITYDTPGCRETVNEKENERSGFLVPLKNIDQLAERMLHFVSNPEDVAAFGKNGYEYVLNKFDVNKVNRHMVSIIEEKYNTSNTLYTFPLHLT